MGIPVTVSPPFIVFIVEILWGHSLNRLFQIIYHASLIFDSGEGRRGSWYEKCHMAISDSRSLDLFLYLGCEINDVRFGRGFHRNMMYFNGHESRSRIALEKP